MKRPCVRRCCSARICSPGSFLKSTIERISVPKQSDTVSPAVSVPQTFHYCKMSFVPYIDGEMFCFISWVGFVRNPSADGQQQTLLLDSEKQIRYWLNVCVCVCVSVVAELQSSSMTTERTSASGMKSTMEGDARRTNQVGALWNSQQPELIWPRGLSALWRARQLCICSNHAGHISSTTLKRTNLSVSEPSQNLYLAFFTYDISKLKLILICNNWTRNSQIIGPVYMTIEMGSLYDFWSSMWHVNQTRLTHLYFLPTTFSGILCYVYQLIWFISWKMAGRQKTKTLRPWLHVCPDQADHLKKTGGLGLTSPDMYIFQKKRLMCMYMH